MGRLDLIAAGERRPWLELLQVADEAHAHVEAHLDDGEVLLWTPEGSREPVGAIQAVPVAPSIWELTLVAVDLAHQGNGHGTAMIEATLAWMTERGVRRVLVGTASAGTGQLGFYQRAGFRLCAIERDHFDQSRGYDGTESENGIAIRDLVWLDRLLT